MALEDCQVVDADPRCPLKLYSEAEVKIRLHGSSLCFELAYADEGRLARDYVHLIGPPPDAPVAARIHGIRNRLYVLGLSRATVVEGQETWEWRRVDRMLVRVFDYSPPVDPLPEGQKLRQLAEAGIPVEWCDAKLLLTLVDAIRTAEDGPLVLLSHRGEPRREIRLVGVWGPEDRAPEPGSVRYGFRRILYERSNG